MRPVTKIHFGNEGEALTIIFEVTSESNYHNDFVHGENGYLMKFTGLKDYTTFEQEIFEGDILHCEEQDEYLEVFYRDGGFYVLFNFDNEYTALTEKLIKANYLVKSGNVFENIELLVE